MIADLKPYPEMKDSGVPWLGKVPEHWEVLRKIRARTSERVKKRESIQTTRCFRVRFSKGVIQRDRHAAREPNRYSH